MHMKASVGALRVQLVSALMVLLLGCVGEGLEQQTQDLIHGRDDRADVYAHPDHRLRELAKRSVVAIVDRDRIDDTDPRDLRFDVPTIGDKYGLCGGERFADDPAIAHCSGTLIADDLVLTASHCIAEYSCDDYQFVFGLYRDGPASLNTITSDDVFSCAGIYQYEGVAVESITLDYVIVQLDRPATPRFKPVVMTNRLDAIPLDRRVAVVGFPWGMPAKIESSGVVTDARADRLDYFVTSSDIFTGNSGSGVFDAETLELVGVLTSYTKRGSETIDKYGCQAWYEVCDACGTSRVSYARNIPGFGACGAPNGGDNTYGFSAEQLLGQASMCDDTTITVPYGMTAPADESWRWMSLTDLETCGGNIRTSVTAPDALLCSFAWCANGAEEGAVSCAGAAFELTGQNGQPGCCIVGNTLDMDVTCGGSSATDAIYLHTRTLTPARNEICELHELSVTF
jgi:hypothetical protein